jgi:hypothetical protein
MDKIKFGQIIVSIANDSTTAVESSVREAEMLMSLTCLSASKFNDCCFLKHSIIKLSDLNLVTFFTSPEHPLIVFSMINGEILVKGFS